MAHEHRAVSQWGGGLADVWCIGRRAGWFDTVKAMGARLLRAGPGSKLIAIEPEFVRPGATQSILTLIVELHFEALSCITASEFAAVIRW